MSLELQKKRFLLLMRQFEAEQKRHHGWQTRFAEIVGTRQAYISDLVKEKDGRSAGSRMIEGAITGFNLAREFFTDPKLGPSPNYRDFVGKRFLSASVSAGATASASLSVAESRTEYAGSDDYPTAAMREAFLETATGRKTDPDDLPAILRKRYEGGATLGRMMDYAATILAEKRGTAVREPDASKPMGANKMGLGAPRKK